MTTKKTQTQIAQTMAVLAIVAAAACGGSPGAGGATTPTSGGGDVGSLTIRNDSSYGIYQLHLSPSDNESWGEDLLGGDPLLPGEAGTAPVVDCAKYDLRLVDDENVECIIQDIDLCFNDEDWTLNDTVLAVCATGWAD